MTLRAQIILILITIAFFLLILRGLKRAKLSTEIAVAWILFAMMLVFISFFPRVPGLISDMIGIKTVTNTIFLIIMFLMICMIYYLCLKVSVLEEKLKNIIQEVSMKDSEGEEHSNE